MTIKIKVKSRIGGPMYAEHGFWIEGASADEIAALGSMGLHVNEKGVGGCGGPAMLAEGYTMHNIEERVKSWARQNHKDLKWRNIEW